MHLSNSRSYVWDGKATETGLLFQGARVWKERHVMNKTFGEMLTLRRRETDEPAHGLALVSGQAVGLAVGPGTLFLERAPYCPGENE